MNDANVVTRIAARGEGVTGDGRFVSLGAPGDVVGADGTLEWGPAHQMPPCRHFPACGGCQLQHVSDDAYRDYVRGRVMGALLSQGIDLPPIDPVHLSPPQTRRRAVLRAERRGGTMTIGFNEAASNRLIDLRECHVLLPALFATIAPLRACLRMIAPEGVRATITLTMIDGGIDMLIAGFEVDGLKAIEALTALGVQLGLARLSVDEGYGPSARYMPGQATITLGGVPVAFPDGAFLQATADGEGALVAAVRTSLADAKRTIDLFSGLGTFALSVPSVTHAAEGMRDAVLALQATKRVRVAHRDLFRQPFSAADLAPFDSVILDPPRAGATEQIAAIAQSGVTVIAYVSCNPATFARDAKVLITGGYRLMRIAPVGQFRWSTHVELAAMFVR